ncbi:MAG: ABC transporter permease, partial [Candidatus Latescibacteria bacterium]|nr:ABC transporter permease [Candidatus Latescibacterota bacterium]
MFKNYLTIAVRNLVRHKVHSLINLSGLAIGMACCILIMLYVQYEFSYDRYHENVQQIYRVIGEGKIGDEISQGAQMPGPLAPALLNDFPEIISATRIKNVENVLISYGEKRFYEERAFFADPSIFEVFSFALIKGNPKTALQEPYSIIITEEMAEKHLGDDDPMGEIISYDNKYDFKITGVLQNIPRNSHFRFDFLASLACANDLFGKGYLESWWNWG